MAGLEGAEPLPSRSDGNRRAPADESGEPHRKLQGTRSVLAALTGEVPDNVFNKDVIAKWRARFGGSNILSSG